MSIPPGFWLGVVVGMAWMSVAFVAAWVFGQCIAEGMGTRRRRTMPVPDSGSVVVTETRKREIRRSEA